jgi:hypothetical protein
MTSPAIAQGAQQALDAAQTALQTYLDNYLTAWEATTGFTLPAPVYYFRGEVIPIALPNTPAIGLTRVSTDYVEYAAEGRWSVLHQIRAVFMLRDGDILDNSTQMDESYFASVTTCYAQAIQQCLEQYVPVEGAAVGIVDCQPGTATEQVIADYQTDSYVRLVGCVMLVQQFVRGRLGAPPFPPPPPPPP